MMGGMVEKTILFAPWAAAVFGVIAILIFNAWGVKKGFISTLVFRITQGFIFFIYVFIFLYISNWQNEIAGISIERGIIVLGLLSVYGTIKTADPKKEIFYENIGMILLAGLMHFVIFSNSIMLLAYAFIGVDITILLIISSYIMDEKVLNKGVARRVIYYPAILILSGIFSVADPVFSVKIFKIVFTALMGVTVISSFAADILMRRKTDFRENSPVIYSAVSIGLISQLIIFFKMYQAGSEYMIYPAIVIIIIAAVSLSLFHSVTENKIFMFGIYRFVSVYYILLFLILVSKSSEMNTTLAAAAALGAMFPGIIYFRMNDAENVDVNLLRYHPEVIIGGLLPSFSGILMIAAEVFAIISLFIDTKPDPVIKLMIFLVSGIYIMSLMNNAFIIMSSVIRFRYLQRPSVEFRKMMIFVVFLIVLICLGWLM